MNNKYILPLVLVIGITALSFMNPIALSVVLNITFFAIVLLLAASIVMNLRAHYPARAAFFDELICDDLIQLFTFIGFTKTVERLKNKKVSIATNLSIKDLLGEVASLAKETVSNHAPTTMKIISNFSLVKAIKEYFFSSHHNQNIFYDVINLSITAVVVTFFPVYVAAVVLFVDLSLYIYQLSLHCKSLNTNIINDSPSWSDRLGMVANTTLNAMIKPHEPLNTIKSLVV